MTDFLPITREEMLQRDWHYCDFLLITGDAYVDHPSFGTAIIGRVLEDAGYRVAILPQPDWRDPEAFTALGRPRYGVLVNGGNIDSMVAHYTAAKKRRHGKAETAGAGLRRVHRAQRHRYAAVFRAALLCRHLLFDGGQPHLGQFRLAGQLRGGAAQ